MSTFNNYQGSNKSERKDINTNSRCIQLYNAESQIEASTLVIGVWNEYLTFKGHLALPTEKRSATSVYDYDHNLTAILSLDKVVLLHERIVDELIPAMKEKRSHSVGIVLPRKANEGESLVTVSYEAEGDDVVFGIFKSLDDQTLKPKEMIRYHFNKVISVTDYNPETGSFDAREDYQGDFKTFMKVLDVSINNMLQCQGHGHRHANRFRDERTDNASKKTLGMQSGSSSYGGYSGGKSSFASKGNSQQEDTGHQAPVEQLSNADAINNFLN